LSIQTESGTPLQRSRFRRHGRPEPARAVTRQIRSKAPLRLSFAGGGTDVAPFPEREGGLVLSATINRYAYGALAPRDDDTICVESVDFGLSVDYEAHDQLVFDGRLDLVKAAIRKLGRGGFDLFLHSSAPPGSGLGSSSSVMVTLIGLLKEYHGLVLTDYEIAEMAFTLEREDLAIQGGLQDQYAAAFGGFNFIEMDGDQVLVNPLRISADVVHELEHNMLLCFTGRTRQSDRIIDDQTKRFNASDDRAVEGLRMQKELAVSMKDALLRRRLDDFGELLGTAWSFKKQMSPRISTEFIDEAYDAGCRAGALGGKVTGAGGGGYMLFYCPFHRRHRVAEALIGLGATVDDFQFAPDGLTTWTVDGR
jgi:D-glycero-alpha-D-manno-heptose-7-phosphate kinase